MDISVLIPLSHSAEHVRACLESLENTMPGRLRYEAILVDVGAPGTPRDFLDGLLRSPRYRLLRNNAPQARAACLNAAAKAARAPLLCLLDPGTALMPGWLEPMHRLLRREKSVGCVGNIHREPYSGLIDHAGIVFGSEGLPVSTGQNTALLPAVPFTRRPAVSVACCLVSQAVFNQLGGFDERFRHRFDDVDFCLRAAEAGFRHFVANRSCVYHHAARVPSVRGEAPEDADLTLYLARWGERARAYHREKAARLAMPLFSPERWEMARESRRQRRQDVRDLRQDGRRYLKKHLLQPWRYNYGRVCHALVRTFHPAPAAIPRPPAFRANGEADAADFSGEGDTMLFDPPRR